MEYHEKTPIMDARKYKLGDVIYVTGEIVLARDEAHKKLLEEGAPLDLKGSVIYHCGPVVTKKNGEWKVVAAGPTTSIRMEIFEDEFIAKFHPGIIVGKGGMGERTLKALKEHGAVYAAYTGGCGALAAERIKGVKEVHFLDELGIPEAVWVFKVEEFGPLVVTMDAHGNSYYDNVDEEAKKNLDALLKKIESES
ncbi:FumA C-terminus/TtdB family hydratase beta subunit [Candidatus Aciduliprofundum boonei]|uniref:Hydro-lyase, Fe-S type, tartrate/fumarate subfamily, beta subunit n=1 Tax=Aciduliprofundum boonei (strain DSM 19572 / T469) TaxID=439481 RepID=D3T9M1_ACIB4|nr:FumA C-terminus/TtdB family hydratase beta subunit [Candidatus Aciduliprofundum boonei]ADD08800.1 hydro-lyase, Fe-S type, tartrate/fumarate subfamily, beta subunit [Aciduliprofundum boonei T469]HII55698.1 fumarate hydratase [Candidatus Aciduliprofundum boonei]